LWLVLFCRTAHDWYDYFLLSPLLLLGVISPTWTKFCGANRRARDIVVHLSKCRIFLQQDKIRVIDEDLLHLIKSPLLTFTPSPLGGFGSEGS
jgi:hypothetical protein